MTLKELGDRGVHTSVDRARGAGHNLDHAGHLIRVEVRRETRPSEVTSGSEEFAVTRHDTYRIHRVRDEVEHIAHEEPHRLREIKQAVGFLGAENGVRIAHVTCTILAFVLSESISWPCATATDSTSTYTTPALGSTSCAISRA